jgi:uncharacterized protein (TIGR02594 family)
MTTEPKWLSIARKYIGTKEIPGLKSNPLILRWWKSLKIAINNDAVAWCAGFVGGVLEEAGVKSSGKANARSYTQSKDFVKLAAAAPGAIVVFWRKQARWLAWARGLRPWPGQTRPPHLPRREPGGYGLREALSAEPRDRLLLAQVGA